MQIGPMTVLPDLAFKCMFSYKIGQIFDTVLKNVTF